MKQREATRRNGTLSVLSRALVFSSALLVLPFACGGRASNESGSNSNWLMSCTLDTECPVGLSCLCGLCTAPCDTANSCGQERASCGTLGQTCVNNIGYQANVCIARCGADSDCTDIRSNLGCMDGFCRERASTIPIDKDPPIDVEPPNLPGVWKQRGAPATCPDFDALLTGGGTGPWGDLELTNGWVSYTTGSTNPEYMFITTSGTWSGGALRVGVSISADVSSGVELTSENGDIEVWLSRYLDSWADQVEVQGVLRVDTYQPPSPISAGGEVVLIGELTVDDGTWALSIPFDLPQVCGDLDVIVK